MADPSDDSIIASTGTGASDLPPALRTYPRVLVGNDAVGIHYAVHEPNFFPQHEHARIQIFLSSGGALGEVTWIDGAGDACHHALGAEQIWITPAGSPHALNWRRRSRAIVLFVAPLWAKEVCDKPPSESSILPLANYAVIDQLIGALKVAVCDEMSLPQPRNDQHLKMLGCCLAARILLAHSTDPTRKREFQTLLHPEVRVRVIAFINENLGGDITSAMLAREARMSVSHFSSVFKVTMGMTPEQYVLGARLWKAQAMIRTGMHTIGEIAHRTGFSDHSHLTVQFKRRFGVPPKAYLPSLRYV